MNLDILVAVPATLQQFYEREKGGFVPELLGVVVEYLDEGILLARYLNGDSS